MSFNSCKSSLDILKEKDGLRMNEFNVILTKLLAAVYPLGGTHGI